MAVGAAVATAHGLYEVAHASKVPGPIAWLYPLVTDGLAMVAYRATGRLAGKSAGYAWTCVVLAAGLSGLGQAVYLSADSVAAAPALRFGVGAWPAIACALVLHLLHLIAAAEKTDQRATHEAQTPRRLPTYSAEVTPEPAVSTPASSQPSSTELATCEPVASSGLTSDDTDRRVVDLARRLARGEDLTGPAIATEHGLSDRTGRRLLADARAHLKQHQPLHLVTDRAETTA